MIIEDFNNALSGQDPKIVPDPPKQQPKKEVGASHLYTKVIDYFKDQKPEDLQIDQTLL